MCVVEVVMVQGDFVTTDKKMSHCCCWDQKRNVTMLNIVIETREVDFFP